MEKADKSEFNVSHTGWQEAYDNFNYLETDLRRLHPSMNTKYHPSSQREHRDRTLAVDMST